MGGGITLKKEETKFRAQCERAKQPVREGIRENLRE